MSQSAKMKKAIISNVLPKLNEKGFYGDYPTLYRKYDDRLEMICFYPAKYGNAIVIQASVVYLNEDKDNDNIAYEWYKFDGKQVDLNTITTAYCHNLYVLKGKFGDEFYYTDVYWHQGMIQGVSEKRRDSLKKGLFTRKLQTSDEHIYDKVCEEINSKMHKVYKWLEKNKSPRKRK